jgi:hypothetical protein
VKRLAAMNDMLSCGLLEEGCPREIQWRNRSLQEFFAAYWLAQACGSERGAGEELWRMIYLPEEKQTADFYWLWRFLAEMPEEGCLREGWVRALRPVYVPGEYVPAREDGAEPKRSNEMIYRSWERMAKWGPEVIGQFRGEFALIVRDPADPRNQMARGLMANFVRCPRHPEDDRRPFRMGSPESEEGHFEDEVQHEVVVDPFRMGKYAVTNAEYELYDPAHARVWTALWGSDRPAESEWPGCPVVDVSWYDGWVYARWLGYRLPTEAEWEYAYRAGGETAYCYGDDPAGLAEYAWYEENSGERLHPVGGRRPNRWGLYDLHGNVWEWCEDWYGPYECGDGPAVNPSGPETGERRVLRGGSWYNSRNLARCACRNWDYPDVRSANDGFRLVASPSFSDSVL